MTTAIYVRVSTDSQERQGTSLSTQLAACLKYCINKGYSVTHKFSETYSGLSLDRPKLNELREMVRTKRIDTIVIYCLDRFTRDPTHGVILTQELEKNGVNLESCTENIETSEIGKLISYIRGVASKLEAEKIKERTHRARQSMLDAGKLPLACYIYGYKWDKAAKKRIIQPYEAEVIQDMFTQAAGGVPIRQIVKRLNEKGVPTKYRKSAWQDKVVRDILKNPIYYGETTFGKTSGSYKTKIVTVDPTKWHNLVGVTPPIITKMLFDQAQIYRKTYAERFHPPNQRRYLLTGHIFCAECGTRANGLGKNITGHTYYRCRAISRGKDCANYACVRTDKLDDYVWTKVAEVLKHPEKLLAEIQRQQNEQPVQVIDRTVILKKRLKALPAQEENIKSSLRKASELGVQDAVLGELAKIIAEKQAIEKELNDLAEEKKKVAKLTAAQVELPELIGRLSVAACSYEDKRLALLHLDARVEVSRDGCSVTGTIPLDVPKEPSRILKCLII